MFIDDTFTHMRTALIEWMHGKTCAGSLFGSRHSKLIKTTGFFSSNSNGTKRKSIKTRIKLQRNSKESYKTRHFHVCGTFQSDCKRCVIWPMSVNGWLSSSHCQQFETFWKAHSMAFLSICLAICIWIWIFWYATIFIAPDSITRHIWR